MQKALTTIFTRTQKGAVVLNKEITNQAATTIKTRVAKKHIKKLFHFCQDISNCTTSFLGKETFTCLGAKLVNCCSMLIRLINDLINLPNRHALLFLYLCNGYDTTATKPTHKIAVFDCNNRTNTPYPLLPDTI